MSTILDNVTVIIRSARERTEELCRKLILDQGIREENLVIVREVPFSESMRKSYQTGIERGLPWTYCIDADVLLRPGSIEYMLNTAEQQHSNVCEIQGLVMDKFFGGPRPAGNHLFRTSLLPEVLERIPAEGEDLRPEFRTLKKMGKDGYPWLKIPYVTGIHDDEQYNVDLYRKGFVHGAKHLHYAPLFVNVWKNNLDKDPDFEIVLRAFTDSIRYTGDIFIDSEQDVYKKMFEKSGFSEKQDPDARHVTLESVESGIQNWQIEEAYLKEFPDLWGLEKSSKLPDGKDLMKVGKRIKAYGLIKTLSLIVGKLMTVIGKKMTQYGES